MENEAIFKVISCEVLEEQLRRKPRSITFRNSLYQAISVKSEPILASCS
jgi:hypothetical protein